MAKYKTEETIIEELTSGLAAWLDQKQHKSVYDPQKEIGWEQGFFGFLSCEWGHRQQRYYNKIGERKLTAKTWGMKVIQYTWVQAKKAWKLRNDIVHDKVDPASKHHYRMEIEDKVKYLYTLENQLSMFDRDLLAVPLEERLQDKTYALEIWHDETYPLIRDCVRDFQARTTGGMKDIRDYFIKKPHTEVILEGEAEADAETEEEIVQ